MDCSIPGLPVLYHSRSLLKLTSTELVMPSNHLILCHLLLFLPSIFSNLKIFSNESDLHIRWPKYWRFSLSISPSNEYSGLISFTFYFDALDKEMATHSSVLAWRIPGTGESGGLPSMGSHRVRHDCSNSAAAAASPLGLTGFISLQFKALSRVFSNTTVQKHQFL